MTVRLSRLLPIALTAAVLAGAAAFAVTSGSASGPTPEPPRLSEDGRGGSDAADCAPPCDDTVDIGAPDIAPLCVEGPAADCVDTVEPGDPIADCQHDPCYDTPALVPDPLGNDCKRIADDMVACIADRDAPVSSDIPTVKPAEPPDAGPASESDPGEASPEDELEADIVAREACLDSGACD